MGNDNTSEGLKQVVGLLVTLVLIGIVLAIFMLARTGANKASADASKDITALQEDRYTQYDGATITGAELLSVIERFEADDICIMVDTSAVKLSTLTGGATTGDAKESYYIKKSFTDTEKLSANDEAAQIRKAKTTTDKAYINPSSQFYGIVKRSNDTNAILGFNFYRIDG